MGNATKYQSAAHPHVHVGVTNAARIVADLAGVRPCIVFISLSWGDGVNTINLYRRDTANGEQLENGAYNINKKTRFERALAIVIGTAAAQSMQRMMNIL